MITLKGKGVVSGTAIGRLFFYRRTHAAVKKHLIANPEQETARFWEAQKRAVDQLQELYDNALPTVGQASAMIFHIHQMMLEDLDFTDAVIRIVQEERMNVEYAVSKTAAQLASMFTAMDDPYMQERAADVRDVSQRILQILMNTQNKIQLPEEPVILAAKDLIPSETVQLDPKKVLAFVTSEGSANSHTAILARNMDIPAIVGAGPHLQKGFHGASTAVDGFTGEVFLYPDAGTIRRIQQKQDEYEAHRRALQEHVGKPNVTLDGQTIQILANINGNANLHSVLENDAEGIGLFRSESIFLERDAFPTEEEQYQLYRSVVEAMEGRPVVIRTMDIGADKTPDYFHLPKEENPALGYRAIRICLDRTDIFKTQLRAICRAAALGHVSLLLPMVSSVWEVQAARKIVREVVEELERENIPHAVDVQLGVMIETPAAALISDRLAEYADFFSIGTNDLTQYLLAIDRQNHRIEPYYNPHHPAVLRAIWMVVQNARKHGVKVGICGELAGDLAMTATFLAMGIDSLSVAPPLILPLRSQVRQTDVGKLREDILSAL